MLDFAGRMVGVAFMRVNSNRPALAWRTAGDPTRTPSLELSHHPKAIPITVPHRGRILKHPTQGWPVALARLCRTTHAGIGPKNRSPSDEIQLLTLSPPPLDEIWSFLATQSSTIDVADRVIDSVTARFALLARHARTEGPMTILRD
jgi:hypothetical protein